ncbi:NAD(P)-dependent oxidoreductase [Nocardia puris]|uniref:3-hydroxyisobutyrate dehydrogenase-like beta-hydroxyacid dehydrogenase n=1 Tax=Nocardia puris TaxID=208602 RepID=A0A366DG53_9NOCA|nr:NAD(P)-binding domain-containing protein [Nocardia puris]RBO88314.1 3-hydroxyisobutyrate dehydrogenase-like beta-hydroxyacid dehydrogenase [Nocardia puris]
MADYPQSAIPSVRVTVLGLGAMGRALADALLRGGHPTTVWNRSAGRDAELVAAGAIGARTVSEAVADADLVIACLLDHASVHEVLDSVAASLAGRVLVNLTSTEPAGARELADWATGHGIAYLDGGIMAVPSMIGQPGSTVLYSGSRQVFDAYRPVFELLGTAEYFGTDAGSASLVDFALLAGMYTMFSGFYHGAAMVRTIGMRAEEFGHRAAAWISAMTASLPEAGAQIDSGDYTTVVQPLDFTKAALDAIVSASRDAGVDLDIIGAVRDLVDRQVAAGHGKLSSELMFESLHPPAVAVRGE